MTHPKFLAENSPFSVSSYYYRVEFQQRGAPHIHCLLWLEDSEGTPAPSFWNCESENESDKSDTEIRINKIEDIAKTLISATVDDAMCDDHKKELQDIKEEKCESECTNCYSETHDFEKCPTHIYGNLSDMCAECEFQKNLVRKFQIHNHTFTCKKKKKTITVRKLEGHGRLDGKIEGQQISGYFECRFNFPQFPMNRTRLILGASKDLNPEEFLQRKSDLKKIRKFLIRQTYSEDNEESERFKRFKRAQFMEFLFEVGMFKEGATLEELSDKNKRDGYQRYINALSVSIRGSGAIFLKRNPKDVFTNNFNCRLMSVHKANHDVQIVIEQVGFIDDYSILLMDIILVCSCSVCHWLFDKM